LADYDYTTAGFYFVTLCTQDRLPLLGRVIDGEMFLSPAGEMVHRVCQDMVPRYRTPVSTLVVMPDHLHAIVSLDGDGTSLSTVMRGIKSLSTVEYGRGVDSSGWPAFKGRLWQKGLYDRVIRDEEELRAVREYTVQNAMRWWLKRQGL
jgi:REP element-mobilizing transposase RayT